MPRVSPMRSCLACRTDLSFNNFDTNLFYHWSVYSCVDSISIPCGEDAIVIKKEMRPVVLDFA